MIVHGGPLTKWENYQMGNQSEAQLSGDTMQASILPLAIMLGLLYWLWKK